MKRYLIIWIVPVICVLLGIGIWVHSIDPFFRYHVPDTEKYYYELDSERNQNDGIIRRFDYDAIITGSSMTENFKTSDLNELFGVNAIKVPFSGASFREIRDYLKIALDTHPNVKMVVRGIDLGMMTDDKDLLRTDPDEFPYYLFDQNPFNDVKYIFNRDVVFSRVYPMEKARGEDGFEPGITTFDDYANWQDYYSYGRDTVITQPIKKNKKKKEVHLSPEEKETVEGNIRQNVTDLARDYPDVDFYCYIPTYSIEWWRNEVRKGKVYKDIEAEKYAIELMLGIDNLHLYSYNYRTDILSDLNHYRDSIHHGEWLNSLTLKWIQDGEGVLTKENYEEYIRNELSFYLNYDYMSLESQEDYDNDLLAAALVNKELTGADPLDLTASEDVSCELRNAGKKTTKNGGHIIECRGALDRDVGSSEELSDYLYTTDYIGARYFIPDAAEYNYIVFYGRKNREHGEPSVFVYDDSGRVVSSMMMHYEELDGEWHQYIIDITEIKGNMTLIFNGGYTDRSGSDKSAYEFRNITLY